MKSRILYNLSVKKALLALFIILIGTLNACVDNNVGAISTVSKQAIKDMLPSNFELHEKLNGIYVDDTLKLIYTDNQLLMKNQISDIQQGFDITSDTIDNRIQRIFAVKKIYDNGYSIRFDLIDIRSDEIPKIFDNSNPNFISRLLSLETNNGYYLTKNQKNSLKKSLFYYFK